MYFTKENKSQKLSSESSTRVRDILGGVACLIFVSPLIFVVFLLLKVDGGPALIAHEHTSPDGRFSTLWQFCTKSSGRLKNISDFLSRIRLEMLPGI